MLIVHDLGEAVGSDIPAPQQGADKSQAERRDVRELLKPLSKPVAARLLALWDEYDAASGQKHTNAHPLVAALREPGDDETRHLASAARREP